MAQQPPKVTQVRVQQQSWEGPLPTPDALRAFNEIVPNGAERIFSMAEREQAHRIAIEDRGQLATIREMRWGQWLGALISLAAIVGAIYLSISTGAVAVPLALLSVPVMSVARALLQGRQRPIARPPTGQP